MPRKSAAPSVWQNRIVGHGEEAPDQLLAHPLNFRTHPKQQQQALSGAITDLGWLVPVIVNRATGHVLDGHLRVELAISRGEPTVPVTYVDLPEELEAEALLTIDPIAAMAQADKTNLDALLRQVEGEDAAVREMLNALASDNGVLVPDFEPVGIEEQGRLDEKKRVTCPECGHEFAPA